MKASGERWSEPRATQLLQEATRLIQSFKREGITVPDSSADAYHARIVKAHDERDVDRYQLALGEYLEAYRAAYRRANGLRV